MSTLTAVEFVVPGLNPGAFSALNGAAYGLGGYSATAIIQGIVNAGGLPGTTSTPSLTLSPSFTEDSAPAPAPVTLIAYLNGVVTTAVTWTLYSGSLGTVSGGVWSISGTVPSHGRAVVIATLNSNTAVIGTATIEW